MKRTKNKKAKVCQICGEKMMKLDYDPGKGLEAWCCNNINYKDENGFVDFCSKWQEMQVLESENKAQRTSEKQAITG